jgi:hypothetical protein
MVPLEGPPRAPKLGTVPLVVAISDQPTGAATATGRAGVVTEVAVVAVVAVVGGAVGGAAWAW